MAEPGAITGRWRRNSGKKTGARISVPLPNARKISQRASSLQEQEGGDAYEVRDRNKQDESQRQHQSTPAVHGVEVIGHDNRPRDKNQRGIFIGSRYFSGLAVSLHRKGNE